MTPKLLDDLSQETKKGLHKLRVINYLLRNKTATMTDIAKELYVSVPTASKILQDLQDGGCIQSQGKLEIGVGRFPLLFGLNPDGGYFIGVDIKRSGMHIGLINLQSELICADYDLPYTLENTPEALETICREIRGFITRHGIQPKEILNINVNLPGRINPSRGTAIASSTSSATVPSPRSSAASLPYASRSTTTRAVWPSGNSQRAAPRIWRSTPYST